MDTALEFALRIAAQVLKKNVHVSEWDYAVDSVEVTEDGLAMELVTAHDGRRALRVEISAWDYQPM